MKMDEPGPNPPSRYKWPWFVLAAFLLGLLLAIVWMMIDVRAIEQELSPNLPSTTNSPP